MNDRTYRLPKAVYYQCIWIVKDIERLKRLESAARAHSNSGELVFFEVDEEVIKDEKVLEEARFKLDCIRRAINELPEPYRENTISSIIYSTPFSDMAHENTWRKWRKVFIRRMAENLRLV